MATDKPRYSITVDPELLERIEDFRYSKRIPTRAEATVELVRLGLQSIKAQDDFSSSGEKENSKGEIIRHQGKNIAAHMESEYGEQDPAMTKFVTQEIAEIIEDNEGE